MSEIARTNVWKIHKWRWAYELVNAKGEAVAWGDEIPTKEKARQAAREARVAHGS